jgi:hypothetical protein
MADMIVCCAEVGKEMKTSPAKQKARAPEKKGRK